MAKKKQNIVLDGQTSIFGLDGMQDEKRRADIMGDISQVKTYAKQFEGVSKSLLKKADTISKMLDDICQTEEVSKKDGEYVYKDKISYDLLLEGGAAIMSAYSLIPADVVEKLVRASDALALMSRVVAEAALAVRKEGDKLHDTAQEYERLDRVRRAWERKRKAKQHPDSVFFTPGEAAELDAEVAAINSEYGFEMPEKDIFDRGELEVNLDEIL